MDRGSHIAKFEQWLGQVNSIESSGNESVQQGVFSGQQLVTYQLHLLLEGKGLYQGFLVDMLKENKRAADIRACSHNIGKHTQPSYGSRYGEAQELVNEKIVPAMRRLESAVQGPIEEIKQKIG